MKTSNLVRFSVSLLLLLCLMSPVTVLAGDSGKKNFRLGMEHEIAEEWDKAVEEFALAVSKNPKNSEYRLHLTRALFNASQMYMKKGAIAAKENDYETAYTAFRRAYAFDPTNELAKSEMERMVRLQKGLLDGTPSGESKDVAGVKVVPTAYQANGQTANGVSPVGQMPQKLEKLRDIPFPGGVDLQFIIKELAKDLDLNVLFDTESFRGAARKTNIDLKNVTAARALDYIFLQEGLFFQKVGPRTILVANQQQRTKFQQLVLRTFYLSNAAPKDVAKVVQTAIPAQPGRSQTIVLTDDATNSITVRDTEENIRLIGKLISSLDKDRAEVVMDVAIYEVSKTDLERFGHQVGTGVGNGGLNNLGGFLPGGANWTGNFASLSDVATSIASGVLIPSTAISAFRGTGNTKLIASTQIHAFNNEDSSARIGQRVPVRTAQIYNGTGNVNNNFGPVSDVINYEQVGLTLKFKPLVFPNQDVQVAMEIESKDVQASAGNEDLTPIFIERTIKGTARIQNNKTLLLASVASGSDKESRAGLPILGWLPIIGRLFTSPLKEKSQIDIVIAVTPRVIRAPNILPDDEVERPTGSLAVPTNSSLEAMIIEEEREENLAAARRMPTVANVQLPDRQAESPEYVRTGAAGTNVQRTDTAVASTQTPAASAGTNTAAGPALKPIDNGVKTLELKQTSDTVQNAGPAVADESTPAAEAKTPASTAPMADIKFGTALAEMKAGERAKIAVVVEGSQAFKSSVIGLKFDDKKVAVRSVTFGDVFGAETSNAPATPFLNQNGKMFVSLSGPEGVEGVSGGTLAVIEIEALADGRPDITFDPDVLNFLTAAGKNFVVKIVQ